MRKFLSLFLCLNLLSLACFALVDDLANSLDKNMKIKQYVEPKIQDEFIPKTDRKIKEYKPIKIDENTREVKVRIKEHFSTNDIYDEGEKLTFVAVEDFQINDIVYPKGTEISARIELISQNKIWGVPASVVVGNFSLENYISFNEISKTGANRTLWVYPLVEIGSWFFGFGLLFIPVRGGHAKISPKETFTLRFYEAQ